MTRRTTSTTQLETATRRRELRRAINKAELTNEEEVVLRMRYGITEPRGTRLEFRGQQQPELKAKLALMEADLIDRFRPHVAEEADGEALRDSIVDELRNL